MEGFGGSFHLLALEVEGALVGLEEGLVVVEDLADLVAVVLEVVVQAEAGKIILLGG